MMELPGPRRLLIGLIAAFLLFSAPVIADDITLSFAPAPITSPWDPEDGDPGRQHRIGVNALTIEQDTDNGPSDFSMVGVTYVTKQEGEFFSGGLAAGEDDAGFVDLFVLNLRWGMEMGDPEGVAYSGSFGTDIFTVDVDGGDDFSSDTIIGTLSAQFSVQNRIPLADGRMGFTPYATVNAVLFGNGTVNTRFRDAQGTLQRDSSDVDVDSTIGLQLGFDLDLGGYSLAAF